MFESQLRELFNGTEYAKFFEFILDNKYHCEFTKPGKELYYFSGYVLEFICSMEDNERKEMIINNCIQNFPEVLGFAPKKLNGA